MLKSKELTGLWFRVLLYYVGRILLTPFWAFHSTCFKRQNSTQFPILGLLRNNHHRWYFFINLAIRSWQNPNSNLNHIFRLFIHNSNTDVYSYTVTSHIRISF